MSEPLDAIILLAADGSPLTCTLSPESVQVIFFSLGLLDSRAAWKQDYWDVVTDADWTQIKELLSNITMELLP